jgi:hypothetical protein
LRNCSVALDGVFMTRDGEIVQDDQK